LYVESLLSQACFVLFNGLGAFVGLFTKLQDAFVSHFFCVLAHTANALAMGVGRWVWRCRCWRFNGGAHLSTSVKASGLGGEEKQTEVVPTPKEIADFQEIGNKGK